MRAYNQEVNAFAPMMESIGAVLARASEMAKVVANWRNLSHRHWTWEPARFAPAGRLGSGHAICMQVDEAELEDHLQELLY